jgi:hypothetical protein
MKTMRKGDDIVRISDKQEKEFLSRGYEYCPKQVWKDQVRVIKEKKEAIKENLESKTKSPKSPKPQTIKKGKKVKYTK